MRRTISFVLLLFACEHSQASVLDVYTECDDIFALQQSHVYGYHKQDTDELMILDTLVHFRNGAVASLNGQPADTFSGKVELQSFTSARSESSPIDNSFDFIGVSATLISFPTGSADTVQSAGLAFASKNSLTEGFINGLLEPYVCFAFNVGGDENIASDCTGSPSRFITKSEGFPWLGRRMSLHVTESSAFVASDESSTAMVTIPFEESESLFSRGPLGIQAISYSDFGIWSDIEWTIRPELVQDVFLFDFIDQYRGVNCTGADAFVFDRTYSSISTNTTLAQTVFVEVRDQHDVFGVVQKAVEITLAKLDGDDYDILSCFSECGLAGGYIGADASFTDDRSSLSTTGDISRQWTCSSGCEVYAFTQQISVLCEELPIIENTTATFCNTSHGSTCNRACLPGYAPVSGSSTRVCSAGEWDGEDLVCQLCDYDNDDIPVEALECDQRLEPTEDAGFPVVPTTCGNLDLGYMHCACDGGEVRDDGYCADETQVALVCLPGGCGDTAVAVIENNLNDGCGINFEIGQCHLGVFVANPAIRCGVHWTDEVVERSCEKSKSITRTFTDSGHTYVQRLTVDDTTKPVITPPGDKTVVGVANLTHFGDAECIDSCATVSPTNEIDLSQLNTSGQITNVWNCKDLCSNSETETQFIDVVCETPSDLDTVDFSGPTNEHFEHNEQVSMSCTPCYSSTGGSETATCIGGVWNAAFLECNSCDAAFETATKPADNMNQVCGTDPDLPSSANGCDFTWDTSFVDTEVAASSADKVRAVERVFSRSCSSMTITQRIEYVDNEAPTISLESTNDSYVCKNPDANGGCIPTEDETGSAECTDTCESYLSPMGVAYPTDASYSDDLSALDSDGVIVRTWTCTDASGNSMSDSQTINVKCKAPSFPNTAWHCPHNAHGDTCTVKCAPGFESNAAGQTEIRCHAGQWEAVTGAVVTCSLCANPVLTLEHGVQQPIMPSCDQIPVELHELGVRAVLDTTCGIVGEVEEEERMIEFITDTDVSVDAGTGVVISRSDATWNIGATSAAPVVDLDPATDAIGVQFTVSQTSRVQAAIGLTSASTVGNSVHYSNIDHGFMVWGGNPKIWRTIPAQDVPGQGEPVATVNLADSFSPVTFKIIVVPSSEANGGTPGKAIQYYVDGELKYETNTEVEFPLYVQASFYERGSEFTDVRTVLRDFIPVDEQVEITDTSFGCAAGTNTYSVTRSVSTPLIGSGPGASFTFDVSHSLEPEVEAPGDTFVEGLQDFVDAGTTRDIDEGEATCVDACRSSGALFTIDFTDDVSSFFTESFIERHWTCTDDCGNEGTAIQKLFGDGYIEPTSNPTSTPAIPDPGTANPTVTPTSAPTVSPTSAPTMEPTTEDTDSIVSVPSDEETPLVPAVGSQGALIDELEASKAEMRRAANWAVAVGVLFAFAVCVLLCTCYRLRKTRGELIDNLDITELHYDSDDSENFLYHDSSVPSFPT